MAPRGNPTGGMDGFDLSSISKAITPPKAPAIDMAGISKAISMPAKTEPSINMTEMSKTISTSISSMTGGESTTKRVQTDDSKSAEKEIDDLRTKFFEDWAKRKEVLIEGMAVEDRKYSKVQAAMKADETAVKMKEEYEKKKEELQKKVDDGINWETTKKQEALEETKKLITEELAITQQGQEARLSELSNEEKLKLIGIVSGAEAENEARLKYQAETVAAIEQHSEKIAADIKGALPIDTEFGDLDGAIKAQEATASEDITPKSAIATPAIDLNAINLPGFGAQMKANAASVPAAVNKPAERQASPGKKINPETGEEYSPVAEMKPKEEKPAQRGGKTAALEDVVKGLDMLNITMNKLLSQSDDLGRKQITALEKNPKNMYS